MHAPHSAPGGRGAGFRGPPRGQGEPCGRVRLRAEGQVRSHLRSFAKGIAEGKGPFPSAKHESCSVSQEGARPSPVPGLSPATRPGHSDFLAEPPGLPENAPRRRWARAELQDLLKALGIFNRVDLFKYVPIKSYFLKENFDGI